MIVPLLKRCPRCRGNLFLLEDGEVREWTCLQCGRHYTAELLLAARGPAPAPRVA